MAEQARVVRFDDGLEVFVFEGSAGVRLDSYRASIMSVLGMRVPVWPMPAAPALRSKRFPSIEELVSALRVELGL